MPPPLAPYQDDLPVPPPLRPLSIDSDQTQHYRLVMRACSRRVHARMPAPTPFWGYEGMYPGPTIEVPRTARAVVEFVNELPLRDPKAPPEALWPFAFEPPSAGDNPHPFIPPAPWTVVHLHGSPNPSDSDGWTDNAYFPGGSAVHHYPPQAQASLLWYHDHAHMITRLNVYAGLAGLYLVRDPEHEADLPGGEFELPLVIQDRDFEVNPETDTYTGRFLYQSIGSNGTFERTIILVNGVVAPRKRVRPAVYRLRILNGSNGRRYNLALRTPEGTGTDLMTQRGTDGGFLPNPVPAPYVTEWSSNDSAWVRTNTLSLMPAERADVLVDLRAHAGKNVDLVEYGALELDVLRFEVAIGPPVPSPPPPQPKLRSYRLPPAVAEVDEAPPVRRPIGLFKMPSDHMPDMQTINGRTFHEAVEETPVLSTAADRRVEMWEFMNFGFEVHPMHVHLVHFEVVDRRPFGPAEGTKIPSTPAELRQFATDFCRWRRQPVGDLPPGWRFVGPAQPADPNECSPKDTVRVPEWHVVRVRVEFKFHTGMYMYHCHILEHEDMDMMRPLLVVPPGMRLMGTPPCRFGDDAPAPHGHGHGHGHGGHGG